MTSDADAAPCSSTASFNSRNARYCSRKIQRQVQRFAELRSADVAQVLDELPLAILKDPLPARLAGQVVVEHQLHAFLAHVVDIRTSDDVGRGLPGRVEAVVFAPDVQSLESPVTRTRATTSGGTRRAKTGVLRGCRPRCVCARPRRLHWSSAAPTTHEGRSRRTGRSRRIRARLLAMGALTASGSPLRSKIMPRCTGDRRLRGWTALVALLLQKLALRDHQIDGATGQARHREQESRNHGMMAQPRADIGFGRRPAWPFRGCGPSGRPRLL